MYPVYYRMSVEEVLEIFPSADRILMIQAKETGLMYP